MHPAKLVWEPGGLHKLGCFLYPFAFVSIPLKVSIMPPGISRAWRQLHGVDEQQYEAVKAVEQRLLALRQFESATLCSPKSMFDLLGR